jgi:hypothetical protein
MLCVAIFLVGVGVGDPMDAADDRHVARAIEANREHRGSFVVSPV